MTNSLIHWSLSTGVQLREDGRHQLHLRHALGDRASVIFGHGVADWLSQSGIENVTVNVVGMQVVDGSLVSGTGEATIEGARLFSALEAEEFAATVDRLASEAESRGEREREEFDRIGLAFLKTLQQRQG